MLRTERGNRCWGRWGRFIVLAVATAIGPVQWGHAQEVGVAARVNGVEISSFRLERHFEDYLKAQGRNVGAIRNPSVFKRLKREALDQLIDKQLLWEEAMRRGIEVDPEEVRKVRAAVVKTFVTEEAFIRRITDAGFDDASYEQYLRQEIAGNQVLQELIGQVEVSDTEIRQTYEQNRDRFERPAQVWARHILLRHPTDGSESSVRAQMEDLLKQIRAGSDFAELARKHSEDSTATMGGDLGYFARGRMVPAFEMAAFALTPGAVSEPVRTEFGWHLIKVEEKITAKALPEAEALAMVHQQLLAGRRADIGKEVLQRLRAAANVDILHNL